MHHFRRPPPRTLDGSDDITGGFEHGKVTLRAQLLHLEPRLRCERLLGREKAGLIRFRVEVQYGERRLQPC